MSFDSARLQAKVAEQWKLKISCRLDEKMRRDKQEQSSRKWQIRESREILRQKGSTEAAGPKNNDHK